VATGINTGVLITLWVVVSSQQRADEA